MASKSSANAIARVLVAAALYASVYGFGLAQMPAVTSQPELEPKSVRFLSRGAPLYPKRAQESGVEALVVVDVKFGTDCQFDGFSVVAYEESAKGFERQFKEAVTATGKEWRADCTPDFRKGTTVQQEYRFRLQADWRNSYSWIGKSIGLTELLTLMDPASIKTSAPVGPPDTSCPTTAKMTLLMPHSPNRLFGVAKDSPLAVWMSQLQLKKQYRLDLLGLVESIVIPCAVFDIK